MHDLVGRVDDDDDGWIIEIVRVDWASEWLIEIPTKQNAEISISRTLISILLSSIIITQITGIIITSKQSPADQTLESRIEIPGKNIVNLTTLGLERKLKLILMRLFMLIRLFIEIWF